MKKHTKIIPTIVFILITLFSCKSKNKNENISKESTEQIAKNEEDIIDSKTEDENPIKIIYDIDGKEFFSEKQIENFTNYEDNNGNEVVFDKDYKMPSGQVFFTKKILPADIDSKEVKYVNFLIKEWRDGPERFSLYQFELGDNCEIVSIFQFPNEPNKTVVITKTKDNEDYYSSIFIQECGNAACYMEEYILEGVDLELVRTVKNYEDFKKVYKKFQYPTRKAG